MPGLRQAELLDDGAAIRLVWDDAHMARFHAIWLRDNSPDPLTRAPGNGQRLITLLDVSADTRIAAARIAAPDDLILRFDPEGGEIAYSGRWLRANSYDRPPPRDRGWTGREIETWELELSRRIPTVSYTAASTGRAALGGWLGAVRRYGFAVMTGLPAESGAVCRVAELFGHVRETNYGRWFEVRSEINPVNLAYTGLGLQAHTDNPYRDPVPTLQLLACLENSVAGGESIVVDGFRAARALCDEAPDSFDMLADHCARFEFAGTADVRLRARRPMIELAPDGELIAVRFNNRSAAPFVDIPYDDMAAYYEAYRRLAEIVERPELRVRFKLAPGEMFIVDNTRVMHAREAFSGTGTRWLQGCYADRDGLLSTLAVIEEGATEAAE